MPNINDRIGSQNVIRVLSNASAPPTRLVNLSDVNSTLKTTDGMILVWDLDTETFFMTDTIDSSSLIATGIATFSNTTQSTSETNGSVTVSGGIGIAKNLNVGGNVRVLGIATFGPSSIVVDGINDRITVGTGVTISSVDGIITPSINVLGLFSGETLNISGVSTLGSSGERTETGGDLYVGSDLNVKKDLKVEGSSEFIGNATFKGGTIGIGDANTDDINVAGEFISNLVPNIDGTYDLGIVGKRWRTGRFSGLVTSTSLIVSGISTFENNVNVTGFVTVTEGLYYDSGDYDGPNGIAYFDNTGKLIGAASTENAVTETYFVLTTNSVGIPTWTSVIDGGVF